MSSLDVGIAGGGRAAMLDFDMLTKVVGCEGIWRPAEGLCRYLEEPHCSGGSDIARKASVVSAELPTTTARL